MPSKYDEFDDSNYDYLGDGDPAGGGGGLGYPDIYNLPTTGGGYDPNILNSLLPGYGLAGTPNYYTGSGLPVYSATGTGLLGGPTSGGMNLYGGGGGGSNLTPNQSGGSGFLNPNQMGGGIQPPSQPSAPTSTGPLSPSTGRTPAASVSTTTNNYSSITPPSGSFNVSPPSYTPSTFKPISIDTPGSQQAEPLPEPEQKHQSDMPDYTSIGQKTMGSPRTGVEFDIPGSGGSAPASTGQTPAQPGASTPSLGQSILGAVAPHAASRFNRYKSVYDAIEAAKKRKEETPLVGF